MIRNLFLASAFALSACAAPQPTETAKAKPKRPAECLTQTGSHIGRSQGQCLSEPGRSYSREDLERGGRPTGDALRRATP